MAWERDRNLFKAMHAVSVLWSSAPNGGSVFSAVRRSTLRALLLSVNSKSGL